MNTTSIAERLHAQDNAAGLYEHTLKLEECNLHYQKIIEGGLPPVNKLKTLLDIMEMAEEGVAYARRTTGILQHQGRIREAEEIRNVAQAQYHAAIKAALEGCA